MLSCLVRVAMLACLGLLSACEKVTDSRSNSPAPTEPAPASSTPHAADVLPPPAPDARADRPPAEPNSPAESHAIPTESFLPSRHGFAFVNSFTGDPLPEMLQETAIARLARQQGAAAGLDVPTRFGLCGGMSAAAADFFRAGRSVPGDKMPPREGDRLYAYLKQRNLDSLGAGLMAIRFIEWMNLPESADGDCTRARTAEEMNTIDAILKRHGLAPIGLVYVDSKTGTPWENHQVLAYRMERGETNAVVHIYDPNFPRDDNARLEIQLTTDDAGRALAAVVQKTTRWGTNSRHVRGVFAMPYASRVPPPELDQPFTSSRGMSE